MAHTFLLVRVVEFVFYRVLLSVAERMSRWPTYARQSELERVYRENIALKTQLDALECYISHLEPKSRSRKRPPVVRASQLLASLLTRGNGSFKKDFLTASAQTLRRWARLLLGGRFSRGNVGGRPQISSEVQALIVRLKEENRRWGAKRIQQELRRMGVSVSAPTIQKVLRAHGFSPHPGRKLDFTRVTTTVKDAIWALDYFVVRLASGKLVQALLIIDIATRTLMDLRVYYDWDVDSVFSITTLTRAMTVSGRSPAKVVHDHGTHFFGQFARGLRVLEIEDELTPPGLPSMNCYAERAIGSVRRELLRYLRPQNAEELQSYLNLYRDYANQERAHQGLAGRSPLEIANGEAEAALVKPDEIRARHLVRRSSHARGLLNAYSLAAANDADGPRRAAA